MTCSGGVEDLGAAAARVVVRRVRRIRQPWRLIDHSIERTLNRVAMTTPHHLPPRPVRALLLLALVAVGVGAWWLLRAAPSSAPLTVSGTVEVDEVTLAAQAAGRLADLSVDEGSRSWKASCRPPGGPGAGRAAQTSHQRRRAAAAHASPAAQARTSRAGWRRGPEADRPAWRSSSDPARQSSPSPIRPI